MTLKVTLQTKYVHNKHSYIYYEYNKQQKPTGTLSFASIIGLVWSYLSQNVGLFQPRTVLIQTKKEKKFSRSQENKLEG